MDRFTYDVNVTDSGDYLFSITSYMALTRHDEPTATDEFLPMTMRNDNDPLLSKKLKITY